MTQDLIKGATDFKHYHYDGDNDLMSHLVKEGQDPKYFIISCIDSRCNPYTIFRAPPGLFFTHKAMGAIVRPYEKGTALSAALQFALEYNNIETIIVLGHTGCGAIKAMAEELQDEEISSFVNIAKDALDSAQKCCKTQCDIIDKTERETIKISTENLKSYPSVQKALSEKRVDIKAWQFDIATGNLLELNNKTESFDTLSTKNLNSDSRKHV